MDVEQVWGGDDGEGVEVRGFVHGDGTTAVLLCRVDAVLTLNLHLSINQARDIAAMLQAAAEAAESRRPCPRGVHSSGCHCEAEVCDCDNCEERRATPKTGGTP